MQDTAYLFVIDQFSWLETVESNTRPNHQKPQRKRTRKDTRLVHIPPIETCLI
jgi:hypothetical protein